MNTHTMRIAFTAAIAIASTILHDPRSKNEASNLVPESTTNAAKVRR
jgi:hypothetical protein